MEVPPVFTRACKKEKILCTCGVHVGYAHSTDYTTVVLVRSTGVLHTGASA